MALYHVDVTVDNSVSSVAVDWFKTNAGDISSSPGFKTLNLYQDVGDTGDSTHFVIVATADSVESVKGFIEASASKLKGDLGQFGDKLKFKRIVAKQVL
ncbi:hypothetical protein TrispH2_006326 [Trichoplax sp. H2]|nr:hypothetical protein TrispH2_006326 [Trichoplax sp. H2]|eukprot:RDD41805.1 hypothetical protein TrispH2_006326 [Trichoplax sp. H2]